MDLDNSLMKALEELLADSRIYISPRFKLAGPLNALTDRSMGKILIIDDSKPIRRLLEYILTRENFEVISTQDGFEAIFWLSEGNRPDLIISDIEMPNFNGEEVISNLNNSGIFSDLPVIILTGLESESIKANCLSRGVFGYLTKPFDPATLIRMVNEAIMTSKSKIKI